MSNGPTYPYWAWPHFAKEGGVSMRRRQECDLVAGAPAQSPSKLAMQKSISACDRPFASSGIALMKVASSALSWFGVMRARFNRLLRATLRITKRKSFSIAPSCAESAKKGKRET